jgi:uncharacterized protein YyaL (SSP411 family)
MKFDYKLFQIAYMVITLFPVMKEGLYNSFERAILNWLEREKRKPLSKFDQWWHDRVFGSENEIVEFDVEEFKDYAVYDKAYPDRFRVKYDENLNRIW